MAISPHTTQGNQQHGGLAVNRDHLAECTCSTPRYLQQLHDTFLYYMFYCKHTTGHKKNTCRPFWKAIMTRPHIMSTIRQNPTEKAHMKSAFSTPLLPPPKPRAAKLGECPSLFHGQRTKRNRRVLFQRRAACGDVVGARQREGWWLL